jgi:predicted small lipoprotein YifL
MMKRFWFFTLGLLFVLAACGQKAPASPFDYNAKVPFDTKIIFRNQYGRTYSGNPGQSYG